MNIGDKVRLLAYQEQGVLVQFKPKGVVTVELSSGFTIDVLAADVSPIAQEESIAFRFDGPSQKSKGRASAKPQGAAATVEQKRVRNKHGLFLAFIQVPGGEYHSYIINNTDYEVLLALGMKAGGKYIGLYTGTIPARAYQRNKEMAHPQNSSNLPDFLFRAIYHINEEHKPLDILERWIKPSQGSFSLRKRAAPVLGGEAYLFQADEEVFELHAGFDQMLKEHLLGNKTNASLASFRHLSPPDIVDLHIEKINPLLATLSGAAMLSKQLEVFEITMENAVATAKEQLTFIHGVGAGVLKTEIHKRLGKHKHIEYYKEADQNSFGFGATVVKFKV